MAGVAIDLGEISEPESQPKLKNIAEAVIRPPVGSTRKGASEWRRAGLGFSDQPALISLKSQAFEKTQ
jgi:hypothetical protein